MGRSPCCEKVGLKKGPWTPEEDQKLLTYIEEHGHGSWRALPAKAGLQRCGKSCRLRWTNYLRPDIKRGKFSLQEEQTIIQLHALLGNRWSAIATHLPKRTDNEIKNYWNTHLKKRLTKMGIDPVTHKPKTDAVGGSGSAHSKDAANINHMAQWESARLEAEARLVRESKLVMISNPLQHQLICSSSSSSSSISPAHHHQLIKKANNSTSAPPPGALPCLDVLKAWQGAWSTKATTTRDIIINNNNANIMNMMAMDDLESPTSTLNFPHSNPIMFPMQQNICNGFNYENAPPLQCGSGFNIVKERLDDVTMALQDNSAWFVDSFRTSANHEDHEDEDVIMPAAAAAISNIMMEGFTDILAYNVPDHDQNNSSLAGGDNSDDGIGGGGGGDGISCGGSGNFEENRSYWDSILNLVNASPSGSPVF